MKITRGDRVLGWMMLLGLLAATIAGQWKHAGPLTLAAIIVGGFVGEAWHRWREGA